MQSVIGKITTSQVTAVEWNQFAGESQNVIEDSGITLSAGDLFQLSKAVAIYSTGAAYFLDTGAADAYVLGTVGSLQNPPVYFDGMTCRFRPGNPNTGASTVNVGGLGVKDIKKENGDVLLQNDLIAARDAYIRFSVAADDFFLLDFSAGTINTARNYIDGFQTILGTDADHDINFGAGVARDSTNAVVIENTAVFTKQLDAVWVEGTNLGGRASAVALSPGNTYHMFAIAKASGQVDFGFDSSLTATNLLADATAYSFFRRLWSGVANASSNWTDYEQVGDYALGKTRIVTTKASPGTSSSTVTLAGAIPSGIRVMADITMRFDRDTVGEIFGSYGSGGVTIAVPSATASDFQFTGGVGLGGGGGGRVLTDTGRRISYRLSAATGADNLFVTTHGYRDFRGRDGL